MEFILFYQSMIQSNPEIALYVHCFLAFLCFSGLVVLTYREFSDGFISDNLIYGILLLGLLSSFVLGGFSKMNDAVFGMAAFALIFLWIRLAVSFFAGSSEIGFSLIKLAAACGAWMGWENFIFYGFFLGLVGLFYSAMIYFSRQKEVFPTVLPMSLSLSISIMIQFFF